MNKHQRSSYEGFRRKSSYSGFDNTQSSTPDVSYMQVKKTDEMKEIDDLSMELDRMSKRSVVPVNLHQIPNLSQSTTFIGGKQTKNEKLKLRHTTSLTSIELDIDEDLNHKQKITGLNLFNKFDTIEESHSFTQEEDINEVDQNSTKDSSYTIMIPKGSQKKGVYKAPATQRKPAVPTAARGGLQGSDKKERIKHDMIELEKMRKELDNKKFKKDSVVGKGLTSSANIKKQREMNFTSQPRTSFQASRKVQTAKMPRVSSKNIIPIASKVVEVKPLKNELKVGEVKVQEKMIAHRMMSGKDKNTLIVWLMQMKDVIEKNEICADSLPEITDHLTQIENLLTK